MKCPTCGAELVKARHSCGDHYHDIWICLCGFLIAEETMEE